MDVQSADIDLIDNYLSNLRIINEMTLDEYDKSLSRI